MLLKTTRAYQLQNEHYVYVSYLFFSRPFFSPHRSDPFCSSLGISFHWWYAIKLWRNSWPWICTSECCATVWHIFPKNSQAQNWCINWGSLISTCFYFSLFLFCLPDTYACAISLENQNKNNDGGMMIMMSIICQFANLKVKVVIMTWYCNNKNTKLL